MAIERHGKNCPKCGAIMNLDTESGDIYCTYVDCDYVVTGPDRIKMLEQALTKLASRFERSAGILAATGFDDARNIAIGYDRARAEIEALLAGYPLPDNLAFRESWNYLRIENALPCDCNNGE